MFAGSCKHLISELSVLEHCKQQKRSAAEKAFFCLTWRVVVADFLLEKHTVNEEFFCALLPD